MSTKYISTLYRKTIRQKLMMLLVFYNKGEKSMTKVSKL